MFKQRRVEEKKRAEEQMREQSKLEQILARQRQKLDQVSDHRLCSPLRHHRSSSRRKISVPFRVMKVHIPMNLNSFFIAFVNNNNYEKNEDSPVHFLTLTMFRRLVLLSLALFYVI